jgi:stearoyl-CoA desaturase (Delta-9 desaturase)
MNFNDVPPARVEPEQSWVISARRVKGKQHQHFILSVVIPTAMTFAGLFALPKEAFTGFSVLLLLAMWTVVGGFGISVGFHRQFAHRAFSCSDAMRLFLGAAGSMAGQGSVIYWTSIHRRHHSLADKPGDLHSPQVSAHPGLGRLEAFVRGHIAWTLSHDVPKVARYAKDLLADPVATKLAQHYWALYAFGYVMPALAGLAYWDTAMGMVYGAFWGGAVRVALGHHVIWSINSLCHCVGKREANTDDSSTNVWWLAALSFGESWHNNHHLTPTAAKFSKRPFQLDLGWWFIKVLGVVDRSLKVRSPT